MTLIATPKQVEDFLSQLKQVQDDYIMSLTNYLEVKTVHDKAYKAFQESGQYEWGYFGHNHTQDLQRAEAQLLLTQQALFEYQLLGANSGISVMDAIKSRL